MKDLKEIPIYLCDCWLPGRVVECYNWSVIEKRILMYLLLTLLEFFISIGMLKCYRIKVINVFKT